MDYKRIKIYVNDKLVYDKCNDEIKVNKLSFKTKKVENNQAPKEIEGEYDLSIRGNKTVLVDNMDGTTVEVKCHPDDDFDIGEGMKMAFDRMNDKRAKGNEIAIGSQVEIVNSGDSYAILDNEWFERFYMMKFAVNYRYGVCPTDGTKGIVVADADGKYLVEVRTASYLGNSEFNDLICDDAIYILGHDAVRRA